MQIPAALEKEKEIKWGDGSFTVVFRQATGNEDDLLIAYSREVMNQRVVRSKDGSEVVETIKWEPEKIPPEKVRLVLVSCDLVDGEKLLLEAGMSRKQFAGSWSRLPITIRGDIYKAVLEVNPEWDPFGPPPEEKGSAD